MCSGEMGLRDHVMAGGDGFLGPFGIAFPESGFHKDHSREVPSTSIGDMKALRENRSDFEAYLGGFAL